MKLSDTQAQILTAVAEHEARLAKAPQGLPAADRNAVFRSMLKSGLLEEVTAPPEHRVLAWRQDESGSSIALRITEAGLWAIGVEPAFEPAADASAAPVAGAKAPPKRSSLRDAAGAVLEA
jgi:hypothetical protein